ncbi:MAG: hypothetical protein K8S99_03775 [Planctomycetes bacterium]|nr:hypothetical protein [Planctomycetota bacterium]
MNRIQLACYGLTASAFVLAGLLLSAIPGRFEETANAVPMVVNRDNITAMTARARVNEDALFLIENNSQKLVIYTLNLTKRRLELAAKIDLNQMFGAPRSGGGEGPGGGRVPR